jgi:hypothetical protein
VPQETVDGKGESMKAQFHADACTKLEDLPNVGPAVAGDLRLLGIMRPKQLHGRDPYKLYDRLCRITRQRHDPCLLDTFIAIVRFMEGEPVRPWWYYTVERKRRLATLADVAGR